MPRRLADRFDLGPLLGAGGMGQVFRAHDSRLRRDVAVKLLPPELATDGDALRRFEREARAIAALTHPNILTVHDYGTDGGRPFLVMELLEGESLRQALAAGPLELSRAVEIAIQVCAGLEAAHRRGVIHRDLKPENVFLVTGGATKILDFGLAAMRQHPAAAAEASPTLSLHTPPGTIAGTPGYMAPEQLRGGVVDTRCDLFACGALLHEMCTGERAFSGFTPFEVAASLLRDPPRLDRLPTAVRAVVSRCLEKDPRRRFQDARELALALLAVRTELTGAPAGSGGTPPEPPGSTAPQPRPGGSFASPAAPGRDVISSFEGRPAIAVLPFANLSSDPDQEFLAEGIVEDLILRLSRWRSFPVIARNSTLAYKGREAEVSTIARELGARYIVPGSVRRVGSRVRIAVQLIDAATTLQIWGDRFDREVHDLFAIQDEVTTAIVVAMHPQLQRYEGERAGRKDPASLDAWELAHRAWWHLVRGQGRDYALAGELSSRALELDPASCWALYTLGMVRMNELASYDAAPSPKRVAELTELAERCVAADPQGPYGHVLLALALALEARFEEMAAEFELAIELDPSCAAAYRQMALHLALAGFSERAIEAADRGLLLSPKDPFVWIFHGAKACAHFSEERDEEACACARLAVQHRRDSTVANEILAASLAHLGRLDEARRALSAVSGAPVEQRQVTTLMRGTPPKFRDRLLDGLRMAGLDASRRSTRSAGSSRPE